MNGLLFVGILCLALISYRLRLLTGDGALASVLVGGGILLGTHLNGLLLLAFFFVSSSFFSKVKKHQKKQAEEIVEKGSTRDAWQVVANGFGATIFSVLYYLNDNEILLYGFILSLAIATSDTWASELGVLSSKRPIHIRTLKRVDRGTSGAISIYGTIMALLGSLSVAILAKLLFSISFVIVGILTILGFIGCMIDTILGAYFQVSYYCTVCHKRVEKNVHCNKETIEPIGRKWVTNDFVNFTSTVGFSIVVITLWYYILH